MLPPKAREAPSCLFQLLVAPGTARCVSKELHRSNPCLSLHGLLSVSVCVLSSKSQNLVPTLTPGGLHPDIRN